MDLLLVAWTGFVLGVLVGELLIMRICQRGIHLMRDALERDVARKIER